MKKQLTIAVLIFLIIGAGIFNFKSVTRTNQNSTTSKSNKPLPTPSLKYYSFDKIGIKFSAPIDMNVTGDESQDDVFILTIQRGKYPEQDYYQLYGILQKTTSPTFDTESVKKDLAEGARDTTVDGVMAVQGQYKGERNNLITLIFTNKGLLKLTTTPLSTESEAITNSILDTLVFDSNLK